MRRFRFFLFLGTIFLTAFFCSGGHAIFDTRAWQSLRQGFRQTAATHALPANPPSSQRIDAQEQSIGNRLQRVFSLNDAVEQSLRRESYVPIRQIPPSLQQAFIAVEDNRFYTHHGFDPEAILRASLVNLQYGQIEEGASTITQQLVKNLFLSHERSFGRKAEELILSLDMEMHYSKDEIMELYLNSIYFGSNFYGIRDAALGYFGKEPRDLTLAETAMLAGLPNAPSLYSPYVDFLAAKKRQLVVLDAMVRNGCITEKDAGNAKIEPIALARTREQPKN